MNEITDIISFLNSIGGFEVKRTKSSAWRLGWKRLTGIAFGLSPSSLSCRRAASLRNIIYTVCRTCLPLASLSTVVGFLFYAAGFLSLLSAMVYTAVFLSLILLSTVIHEYTHAHLVKLAGRSMVILQRGMRLGILHQPLTKKQEALSAIAGPLAGGLSAVLAAAILSLVTTQGLIFSTGILVAIFHIVSLLPAYGDGQTIKQLLGKEVAVR